MHIWHIISNKCVCISSYTRTRVNTHKRSWFEHPVVCLYVQPIKSIYFDHIATRCNTLQHAATHYNTLAQTPSKSIFFRPLCNTLHNTVRDMNHSYAQHDSVIRATWLSATWLCHIWTWLTHIHDTTHSYVQNNSRICAFASGSQTFDQKKLRKN